ncbi:Asp23/Gls24 family envelope stress response protein [Corynebacterium sp. TAE3-ERU12]|uniref:Asp23/Gls24 family envelope stress response protein n=1 Tax=Corynebacterium sp. TAE3-ERU12 TaxID=2849491 RepID=UPI001C45CBC8|nr:Asp23/Gls24 family envelope stress response protein [Corynebacterium sp. TAE3-ERU12]MBV7294601.1 Asp23/Gls24 family envelope stress response protein [Corynebacterium sp. TAE3-ERU12]
MSDNNKQNENAKGKAVEATGSTEIERSAGGPGRTVIEDSVVNTIAAIAASEVSGVYALGSGSAFTDAVRNRMPGGAVPNQHGVTTEVGKTQAAVDVSIVAEYGVAIHELAGAIRKNVTDSIERMTGLEVTEVNITVHDIHLEDADVPGVEEETNESRVN